jgi:hypothetical protein
MVRQARHKQMCIFSLPGLQEKCSKKADPEPDSDTDSKENYPCPVSAHLEISYYTRD